MPLGKLRSGGYRSFIMCDDPRGVVDSGAIKKQSKKSSKFEISARKSTEDAPPHSSSLQLSRVSKGIQKLNVAIESWSKGSSKGYYEDLRPEDIAKDLLRGALDLEESLAMLTSFQEDCIKQKPRISKDARFQRSMSDRFEKRMISQENNAASRDCYEDLRKVIKDNFRIPERTSTETKSRVVRNGFASTSGAASSSTSSSQSSMVSGSTKSSASSDIPRRAPNLIARLMGLDLSSQEPVNHIDKTDSVKISPERQEQLNEKSRFINMIHRKEPVSHIDKPETSRWHSTRGLVLQSFPDEMIPSKNPLTIVHSTRPMRVVKPEMEEKPEDKGPVLQRKSRMQGEVHPNMINQRKDHQAVVSNKMKLPSSLIKKDKEPKQMLRKVEENEGKVMKLLSSPSNVKAVTREQKPLETKNKLIVGESKDRHRTHDRAIKLPNNPAAQKKQNTSSKMSKTKSRRSKLNSSSSNSREKKSGEASRLNAKKKLHQQGNDIASENTSTSSLNQISTEENTSSEINIQGHCDNGEVTSCEPETTQISLKSFLSNSQEFLKYATNLFDLGTKTKRSKESTSEYRDNVLISDQRLALDFAKEVAKRRSLVIIAELSCPQRCFVDIDELLMEVCDGFETLTSYRDTFLGQESFVKENIQMVLEKDLESKKREMTSGVWDLGWRSEFQIDEIHQAVVDLEKLILSSLIQEILP